MENLKVSVFSDSILISLKLAEPEENNTQESAREFLKEIRFISTVVQKIQYLLLKQGNLVRGIIRSGEIVHNKMQYLDVFYGNKFIEMHDDEKNKIRWPMVVLDIPPEILLEKIENASSVKGETIEQKIINSINYHYDLYYLKNRGQFIFPLNKFDSETEHKFCLNPFYNLYFGKRNPEAVKEVKTKFKEYLSLNSRENDTNIIKKWEWLEKLYNECQIDAERFLKQEDAEEYNMLL